VELLTQGSSHPSNLQTRDMLELRGTACELLVQNVEQKSTLQCRQQEGTEGRKGRFVKRAAIAEI